jgi:hypothetical protein
MEKIPNTWGSLEFNKLLDDESFRLKGYRSNIAKRFGLIDDEIAKVDLTCLAMPEILASQFLSSERPNLVGVSPSLQAFLTYSLSLYDIISDNHLFKNGTPTFLKTYGLDYLLQTDEKYRFIWNALAEELEDEFSVSNARQLANEIYYQTIEADKTRNAKIFPSETAFLLQSRIAGEQASRIALLSKSPHLCDFALHLVNAITTIEDLCDIEEDLSKPKTTIPLSLLIEEFGQLPRDSYRLIESSAIQRTKEYIEDQLGSAESCFIKGGNHSNILQKAMDEMHIFLNKIPKK